MKDIKADYLVAGDAGVFHINKNEGYDFKMIYDVSVFVTSSRQVNFWGDHGASEVVLAREIPSVELFKMSENLRYPAEVLVYGATVIHHSKRPLLQNYYNFTHIDDEKHVNVVSSLLNQAIKALITQFLRINMAHIF